MLSVPVFRSGGLQLAQGFQGGSQVAQGRRSLNENEMRSLQRLSDRFILEWSLSLDVPLEEARQAFNALTLEAQAKEP